MQLSRDSILQTLTAALPALRQQYGLTELALFGSYARGDQQPDSDIDLMVSVEKTSFRNYSALCEQLAGLFPGTETEVVSRQAIRPQYFQRLQGDLLYA